MTDGRITRCSQCGYVNPEGANVCGMCGTRLGEQYPQYEKRLDKKSNYEKSIVRGTIQKAAGYGSVVWEREMFRVIAMLILGLFVIGIPLIITSYVTTSGAKITWLFIDYWLIAAMLAGIHRGYLDIVRDRRLEPARVMSAAITQSPRVMVVMIPAIIFGLVVLVLIFWWAIAVEMMGTVAEGPFETIATFAVFIMVIVLVAFLVIPTAIWLNIYTTLAVCRTLDRRESLTAGIAWVFVRIAWFHSPLLKLGGGEIVSSLIGLAICIVGVFATAPLATIQNVAVYEWIRLHGPDPDSY